MPAVNDSRAVALSHHIASLQLALKQSQDSALRAQHHDLASRSFVVDPPPANRPAARTSFAASNKGAWSRYFDSNPTVRIAFSDEKEAYLAFMSSSLVES